MAECPTTTTAADEKQAEAWGLPPAYNTHAPPCPPVPAPPPATYANPAYSTQPVAPPYQPQQPQQPHIAVNAQHNTQNQTQYTTGAGEHGPAGSRKNWADGSARVCGALQMVCGILMFIFHIVAIVIDSNLHEIGFGIWGGLFMLITGVIGVVAANKKSTGSIVAFMVLSILISILCLPILIMSAIGLSKDVHGNKDYYWGFFFNYNDVTDQSRAAMNGLMMMVTIIEAVVAITSSALCCRAVCCGANSHNPSPAQVSVVYAGVPYTGQYPGGHYQQVMFVPYQPTQFVTSHQHSHGGTMTVTHGATPIMSQHVALHSTRVS